MSACGHVASSCMHHGHGFFLHTHTHPRNPPSRLDHWKRNPSCSRVGLWRTRATAAGCKEGAVGCHTETTSCGIRSERDGGGEERLVAGGDRREGRTKAHGWGAGEIDVPLSRIVVCGPPPPARVPLVGLASAASAACCRQRPPPGFRPLDLCVDGLGAARRLTPLRPTPASSLSLCVQGRPEPPAAPVQGPVYSYGLP